MWYIHTMEYYSAMKRNEVLTRDDRWMVSEKHCAKGSSQTPSPQKKILLGFIGLVLSLGVIGEELTLLPCWVSHSMNAVSVYLHLCFFFVSILSFHYTDSARFIRFMPKCVFLHQS